MSACLGRSVVVPKQTRFRLATYHRVQTAALLARNFGPVNKNRFLRPFSFVSTRLRERENARTLRSPVPISHVDVYGSLGDERRSIYFDLNYDMKSPSHYSNVYFIRIFDIIRTE